MRAVFIGSGYLACPALRALRASNEHEIALVITPPDRPAGRKRRPAACPVKALAESLNRPVITPEKISAAEVLAQVAALRPDVIIVADYGQFLPEALIRIPPMGTVNIHPSLLPKYRGAAPVQWTLINGDDVTGVTIAYVTKEMDAGDILLQCAEPVREEDTAGTLYARLAARGAEMLLEALERLSRGEAAAVPQDHALAVPAPRLRKEDGRMDFTRPARDIVNRVRGLHPWPGSHTVPPDRPDGLLKVLQADVADGQGTPGEVIRLETEGPVIAAGEGAVLLRTVQPAGKKPMGGADYVRGYGLRVGQRLHNDECRKTP